MIEGNYRIAVAVVIGMALGFSLIKSDLVWRREVRSALALRAGRLLNTVFLALCAGIFLYQAVRYLGWVPAGPQVRPAFLWTSLLGGMLCGAGILICGNTPTTALAAFGGGRLQALWGLAGMALAYPAVRMVSSLLSETVYRRDVVLSRPEAATALLSAANPALYAGAAMAVLILLVHFTIGDSGR